MISADILDRIRSGSGFIAALDQSGGSTPKALKGYGISTDAFSTDEEMFGLIHDMRSRIVTSPAFSADKVLGAILFERTMDGHAGGKPVPHLLRDRGVVPFLKVDKGLEEEADGVQLMKPIPALATLLARAKGLGIVGTKMRSVVKSANADGIAAIIAQQFEVGTQIFAMDLVPILEPEYDINAPDRAAGEQLLKAEILKHLNDLSDGCQVMLKLSIPVEDNTYAELIDHPAVLRVVALSGGFGRKEACEYLSRNRGMIASFSRALLNDLRASMSDEEFDAALSEAIDEISCASAT